MLLFLSSQSPFPQQFLSRIKGGGRGTREIRSILTITNANKYSSTAYKRLAVPTAFALHTGIPIAQIL